MTEATTHARDAERDVLFDLLSSPRRRELLAVLRGRGGAVEDIGVLADYVAAAENDKPVDSLTARERKRVYVSLYQTHLPKLRDAGAIEWDERGTIRLTPRMRAFESPLGWSGRRGRAGGTRVGLVALAALCGLLYAGALADAPVLGAVPTSVAGGAVVVALLAAAVVVARRARGTPLRSPDDATDQ